MMIRQTVPVLGTTMRQVRTFQRMHRLPDKVIMAGLSADLAKLYADDWFACLMFEDGRGSLRGPEEDSPAPGPEVSERMLDLAIMLNRTIAHGGHWIVVWSKGRLSLLWRDSDGDAQFTVDFDEPWVRVREWAVTNLAERAEAGHAAWVERMRAVDRKDSETIKAAQGEQSRSPFPSLH